MATTVGSIRFNLNQKQQLLFQDSAWSFSHIQLRKMAQGPACIHILITLMSCLSLSCHQTAHHGHINKVCSSSSFCCSLIIPSHLPIIMRYPNCYCCSRILSSHHKTSRIFSRSHIPKFALSLSKKI